MKHVLSGTNVLYNLFWLHSLVCFFVCVFLMSQVVVYNSNNYLCLSCFVGEYRWGGGGGDTQTCINVC